MKLENDLGRDSVGRLVLRIALPSMLAQFVSVFYSIVDRMYIGHIPGAGALALAGVGVCGPVVTMIGATAFWVSTGGSPLMSIRLGEGKDEEAGRILSNCFVLLIAFALALTAMAIPLREPMLRLFGASEATYPYAEEYFVIYMAGTVFALLSSGLNQFIVAQGFARAGMALVMLGAALNIVLDPLLIFLLDWGVGGAAAATVISQAASALGAVLFLRLRAPVRLTLCPLEGKRVRRVLTLGFTPFAIISIDAAMIIAMNAVLQHYGGAQQGDLLVTCATIAQSGMLVITMPLGGITSGTETILGYNYGAMKLDRVRKAQRAILMLCVGFVGVMFVLARALGPAFVSLFTKDAQIADMSFWAIRVFTLAIIPLGIQYELVDGFTAMGQVRLSFTLSFFRKAVYFGALFALPAFFGAKAAFYAEPVSDVVGPLFTVIVHRLAFERVLRRRQERGTGV